MIVISILHTYVLSPVGIKRPTIILNLRRNIIKHNTIVVMHRKSIKPAQNRRTMTEYMQREVGVAYRFNNTKYYTYVIASKI